MGDTVTLELTGETAAMVARLLDGGRWADAQALCADALKEGLELLTEYRKNEDEPVQELPPGKEEPF